MTLASILLFPKMHVHSKIFGYNRPSLFSIIYMQVQLISKSTVTLCNQTIQEITLVRISINASVNSLPPSSYPVFLKMYLTLRFITYLLMLNLTSKSLVLLFYEYMYI